MQSKKQRIRVRHCLSLLAGLSISKEDTYPSPSRSGSNSSRETRESPEILSKFKYCVNASSLMLVLFTCVCVRVCVCVCVCARMNNVFLCVSAWRQEDYPEPNAFYFKCSIQ